MTNIARNIAKGAMLAWAAALEPASLVIGASLVSAGAWSIYRPAGLITAGVLLIAGVILRGLGDGAR